MLKPAVHDPEYIAVFSARGPVSNRGAFLIRPADPLIAVSVLLLTLLAVSGCAGAPPLRQIDAEQIPNAVPVKLPESRSGNPDSYVVDGRRYHVLESSKGYSDWGFASWYGPKFDGKRTASGEKYDMYAMTAANKVLPLPTFVRVTALETHRSVVVKVNDRGPFHPGRIIDLSYAAATKLGIIGKGRALVKVQALTAGAPATDQNTAQPASHPAGLYLQAGAFNHEPNARRLLKRLNAEGLSSAFMVKLNKTQNLYSVRVGPYATPSARDAAARRLRSRGVVPVDVNK